MAGRNGWDLLTRLQSGPFAVVVLVVCAGVLALYLAGVRKYEAEGALWPFWRTEAFVVGVAGIGVGACSGLAVYAGSDVTLHIVCHLILMMTVPALVSLGRPIVLADRAGGRRVRALRQALARLRLARALTHPVVVWTAYLGSMYLMLTDRSFFNDMMVHSPLMDANEAAMVAIGLLYWGSLVASPGGGRDIEYPARVVSILATMPFEVLAGIWLRYQTQPLMKGTSVSGTQLAGEVFIVGATLVSTVWLGAVIFQWAAQLHREEVTGPPPAGDGSAWTVPWWVASRSSSDDGGSGLVGDGPLVDC